MSTIFELNAVKRDDMGKGASRRLRRVGMVPAIVYGAGKDPESISLVENDLMKSLEHEAFYSQILTVNLDGSATQVVLRDLQRHPFKPRVQHLDLQRIDANKALHVHLSLHFLNEETAPGVKAGGLISHEMIEVEIACLPKDLPEYIEVDLGNMDVGDAIHLSDLKVPDGVTIVELTRGEGHDQSVVSLHAKKGGGDEEAEAAVEEGGEEGGAE